MSDEEIEDPSEMKETEESGKFTFYSSETKYLSLQWFPSGAPFCLFRTPKLSQAEQSQSQLSGGVLLPGPGARSPAELLCAEAPAFAATRLPTCAVPFPCTADVCPAPGTRLQRSRSPSPGAGFRWHPEQHWADSSAWRGSSEAARW